jgi:Tfp pilus assembly protein PilF
LYFNASLKIDPNYYECRLDRAKLYLKNNNLAMALADITTLIELDPKNPNAYEFKV